jgi:hypothetical protein
MIVLSMIFKCLKKSLTIQRIIDILLTLDVINHDFFLNDIGPYHDTLIKFNHDSNYPGDEFVSFWQVITA